jgi:hypothetical protein
LSARTIICSDSAWSCDCADWRSMLMRSASWAGVRTVALPLVVPEDPELLAGAGGGGELTAGAGGGVVVVGVGVGLVAVGLVGSVAVGVVVVVSVDVGVAVLVDVGVAVGVPPPVDGLPALAAGGGNWDSS